MTKIFTMNANNVSVNIWITEFLLLLKLPEGRLNTTLTFLQGMKNTIGVASEGQPIVLPSCLVFKFCRSQQNVFCWLSQLTVTRFVVAEFMFASLLLFLFERVEYISSGTRNSKNPALWRGQR